MVIRHPKKITINWKLERAFSTNTIIINAPSFRSDKELEEKENTENKEIVEGSTPPEQTVVDLIGKYRANLLVIRELTPLRKDNVTTEKVLKILGEYVRIKQSESSLAVYKEALEFYDEFLNNKTVKKWRKEIVETSTIETKKSLTLEEVKEYNAINANLRNKVTNGE
jgi:hypothetical protein